MNTKEKQKLHAKRVRRVRTKIQGNPERLRMIVSRSLNHIYVQLVDDLAGKTMLSAGSLSPEIREEVRKLNKVEGAKLVGKLIAQKAIEKGLNKVVFDRHGYRYHGRVKALAESAREGGLIF